VAIIECIQEGLGIICVFRIHQFSQRFLENDIVTGSVLLIWYNLYDISEAYLWCLNNLMSSLHQVSLDSKTKVCCFEWQLRSGARVCSQYAGC
jgi:hypothetical protein